METVHKKASFPRLFSAFSSGLLIAAASSPLAAPPSSFGVQVAAFSTESEAQAAAAALADAPDVTVVTFKTGTTTYHRLVVGRFPTREDAEAYARTLPTASKPLIRAWSELDTTTLVRTIYETTIPAYFRAALKAPATTATLEALMPAEREGYTELLNTPTTAPGALTKMVDFVTKLLATEPMRARATVEFARRYIRQNNPYKPITLSMTPLARELLAVADGDIAATDEDRWTARKFYVRYIHYYQRDGVAAVRAWRQIAREAEPAERSATLALARMEMCAAAFELVRDYGLSYPEFDAWLTEQFELAMALQRRFADKTDAKARQTRWTTARIGLMHAETIKLQVASDAALAICQALIDAFDRYPECQDEIATARSYMMQFYAYQHRYRECLDAAEKCFDSLRRSGRVVWGDERGDMRPAALLYIHFAASALGETRKAPEAHDILERDFPTSPMVADFLARSREGG